MTDLNTTLITGASEGIGKCFANEFANNGHDLILVARNESKLSELADELTGKYSVNVDVIALDLLTEDAPLRLKQQIAERNRRVDILINNAGVINVTPLLDADVSQLHQLLDLNIKSLVQMCHTFLPEMFTLEQGKIVNVASIAGFLPTPGFATYGASKAFVLSFSEALAEECKHTGVDIHCVCPGFTKTHMLDQGNGLEKLIPQFMKVTPESLVRDAYKSIMKGETLYVDKLHNKLLVQWAQLYPRWMVRGVTGFLSRLKK